MTREQTMTELEQDLEDRYPWARVAVTDEGGQVMVAVDQPGDSVRLRTGMAGIEGGSFVLARILASRPGRPLTHSAERVHGTGND